MYSGVVGMMPSHPTEVTDAVAQRIRAAGFTGVSVIVSDPASARVEEYAQAGRALAANGVAVAQCNARYPDLVSADEASRREGIRLLSRTCAIGSALGAGNVYVRPGSLNVEGGSWSPHLKNTAPETFDRLVDSMKQVSRAAEGEGVQLAIEGHVVSPLPTPERVRELLERVGSPVLRFNTDPVNFVGTLADLFDTTAFLNHLFDVLGPDTICGHVKDVTVRNHLVLHLDETLLGTGYMDLVTLVRRFEACCPDGTLLIEHLGDVDIPKAKAALDAAMIRAGLAWRE